ncbi:hypothetical protein GUJ93_ZPchr0002g25009 [Zizania palustris]|uniref:Uncharacterized protein n=1 Tax=Zizania palustris TaxID=103762 RepID=A0A8J5SD91_ZIZPA|nr:hypothetical protein GUJ93_ZPchr0002g25009 [Zizania palustris]
MELLILAALNWRLCFLIFPFNLHGNWERLVILMSRACDVVPFVQKCLDSEPMLGFLRNMCSCFLLRL